MILIQAAVWQKVGWFPAALEKGWTDRRYHTGDEKKDRSEAKLLIDFRKATGPTHTHTHTRFPRRLACNPLVHRVRRGFGYMRNSLHSPDDTAGLDACPTWGGGGYMLILWVCQCGSINSLTPLSLSFFPVSSGRGRSGAVPLTCDSRSRLHRPLGELLRGGSALRGSLQW